MLKDASPPPAADSPLAAFDGAIVPNRTGALYRAGLALVAFAMALLPAFYLARESAELAETDALIGQYYGVVRIGFHPLFIERQLPVPVERAVALAEWRAACAEIEALREEAEKISVACIEQLERRGRLLTAYHLAKADFEFSPEDFGLPDHATTSSELRTATEVTLPDAETAIDEHLARLEPFFAALRRRIGLALTFHANSDAVSSITSEESAVLLPLVAALGAEMKEVLAMADRLRALGALIENRGNHPDTTQVDIEARELAFDLRSRAIGIKERVGGLIYPFAHSRGHLTVAEYLHVGQSPEFDWRRSYEGGIVYVNRLIDLHRRLIGRTLAFADSAEKAAES
ncbi:MAG: hypothetical protein AB7F09_05305 [Parvibaculaceae bacterium]